MFVNGDFGLCSLRTISDPPRERILVEYKSFADSGIVASETFDFKYLKFGTAIVDGQNRNNINLSRKARNRDARVCEVMGCNSMLYRSTR